MKIIILSLALIAVATAAPPRSEALFSLNLFQEITKDAATKNVVFSPVSIKTAVGLLYLGAEGETANEIKKSVQLSEDKEIAAQEFSKLTSKSAKDFKLNIVNRVYVDKRYDLAPKFNELASKYFGSAAEKVQFSEGDKVVETINTWVEDNTANKIKDLIPKGSLDSDTMAVLVNAIYFKAKWLNTFEHKYTKKQDFTVSKSKKVSVDMMEQSDKFVYGEFPELDAKALELKYADTDLSMTIFLPNTVDGLPALEEKLSTVDRAQLAANMQMRPEVNVVLPKFKIEYEIDLKPVLENLGLNSLFSTAADFSSLFAKKESAHISEAAHKAFIEVNEDGTEAAAATYGKLMLMSAYIGPVTEFIADHPFLFIIKDANHVYFTGHVVDF